MEGGLSPQVGIDDMLVEALMTEQEPSTSTQRKRRVSSRRYSTTSASSTVSETRTRRNTSSTEDPDAPLVTKFGRKVKRAEKYKCPVVPEVEKEESHKLKYYKQIIRAIFHESVLKIKFEEFIQRVMVEGYNEIIKKPMWIEKIQSKLDRNEYCTAEEFEADFDLMINNCYTFNPECNPENAEIRKCCKRLEEWWENCKEHYKSWDSKSYRHYCYASLLPQDKEEEEEEDNTPWTQEEIVELVNKIDQIPLGKLAYVLGIIRHSEPIDLAAKIMKVNFAAFKPSTLNALNKECNKRLAEIKREKETEAKRSAKSEKTEAKKKARREDKDNTGDTRDEASNDSAAQPESDVNENQRLSDSEASSGRESSSSESSSGSSSSEAETESEDEEEQPAEKSKPKAKKQPQLKVTVASAEPNLSEESETSDKEDALTEESNQAGTSGRLQTGTGPYKRKPDSSEAPSGYTATPPFKKIKESAPRRLDFSSSEGFGMPSDRSISSQEQPNVLSFGIIKIPVETPGQQIDKMFGGTPKHVEEKLPEISADRKALRDEAARLRRAAATIPDPTPLIHPTAPSERYEADSFSAVVNDDSNHDHLFHQDLNAEEPLVDGNYQMDTTYHGENEQEEEEQEAESSKEECSLTSECDSSLSKSEIQDNEDSSPGDNQRQDTDATNTEATQEDDSGDEVDLEDALDYSEC